MAGPVTWGAFAGDEDVSFAAARRFGITHVLFDKLQFADRDVAGLAIASARMRECCFMPFYEDDRIVIYELNSEGVARRSVGKRTTDDH